ncbi:MAG: KH domain-containing protein [Candidatus Saccharimonadales bacterium]
MNNIDQQFIEYIVKALVGKPDAVSIERRIDEKGVLLELTVDPEDLGRVIGKRGATAQSLRTLLRALGTKNDARYNLKIIDNGEPDYRKSSDQPVQSAPPISDDDSASGTDDSTSADAASSADDSATATDDAADQPHETGDQSEVDDSEAAESPSDDASDDKLSKTRKELEDFDDLDI